LAKTQEEEAMSINRFRRRQTRSSARRRRALTMEHLEDRMLMSGTYQQAVDASAQELYMLELVNRMRMDPQAELSRLVNSNDSDVNFALSYFNVDKTLLANQWKSLTPVQPLAWNNALGTSAQWHSNNMHQQDRQFHDSATNIGQRLNNAGYNWAGWGENVYAYAKSIFHGHAGFAIDWGYGPGGMNNGHGHRNNIMNPGFRELGIGVVTAAPGKNTGPLLVTQNFGRDMTNDVFVTGVCYNDLNNNNFYDVGEGMPGVVISAGDYTHSGTSGGYTLKVPKGTYSVTMSGRYDLKSGAHAVWSAATPQFNLTANHKLDRRFSNPDIVMTTTGPAVPELPPDQPPFGEFSGPGQDMIIFGPGWEDGMDAYVRVRTGSPVYVKGTDAFDKITIARHSDTQATVTVEAFQDARFTRPVGGALTYTFDIGEGILVESGSAADRIVVHRAIGANVTVNAGAGNDLIDVRGFAARSNVMVHAGEGTDQIRLRGSPRKDTAVLRPGSVDLTGSGYEVHADSVEKIRVYARGERRGQAVRQSFRKGQVCRHARLRETLREWVLQPGLGLPLRVCLSD
jgi:uncharacterized protein YkwD